MSSTDLSGTAAAVSRIQIEGPTASAVGKIDLTDQDLTKVMPGELDENLGKNPVPPQRVSSSDTIAGSGTPATAHVVGAPIEIDLDAEDVDAQIAAAAEDVVRRANPDALFDAHAYDETPYVDGQATDTIQIALSGGVKLEATTDEARELFARLKLGKYVVARIEGIVAKKGGGYRENADGESSVTGSVTIKASEVRLLSPEELS